MRGSTTRTHTHMRINRQARTCPLLPLAFPYVRHARAEESSLVHRLFGRWRNTHRWTTDGMVSGRHSADAIQQQMISSSTEKGTTMADYSLLCMRASFSPGLGPIALIFR
jgi:hypothetical protein